MVRSTRQAAKIGAAIHSGYSEALDLRVTQCLEKALLPLTPTQEMVVRLRCGVYSEGRPLSMADIGSMLGELGHSSVSRQYVHAAYRKALARMGSKAVKCLSAQFPSVAVPNLYDLRDGPSQKSLARLKAYFFRREPLKPIQYAEVMRQFGAAIPKHRERLAAAYSEVESCWAFYEDFGIRRFGTRFKVCTRCPKDKAMRRIEEFYRYSSGVWMSACIECNSRLCREKQAHKKAAMGASQD